jgi:hypothetical protein
MDLEEEEGVLAVREVPVVAEVEVVIVEPEGLGVARLAAAAALQMEGPALA